MHRTWVYTVLGTVAVAAAVGLSAAASGGVDVRTGSIATGPPAGLSVYAQTLWNLEALLHDTYGNKPTCLRSRDYAFVSATCGDLARNGYWKNIFVSAHHSRFKLVRLSHPPAMGNVWVVTMKGLYVSCGSFPGWGAVAGEGSRTRRWLVVLHGWAMTPFVCLGQ
jgi:hypothetical protein